MNHFVVKIQITWEELFALYRHYEPFVSRISKDLIRYQYDERVYISTEDLVIFDFMIAKVYPKCHIYNPVHTPPSKKLTILIPSGTAMCLFENLNKVDFKEHYRLHVFAVILHKALLRIFPPNRLVTIKLN